MSREIYIEVPENISEDTSIRELNKFMKDGGIEIGVCSSVEYENGKKKGRWYVKFTSRVIKN